MNNQPKLSQRKQIKSVVERVDTLEGDVQRIYEAVNQTITNSDERIRQLASLSEAYMELLGTEAVDAKLKEINERRQLESVERAKAVVVDGLTKGTLVKALVIGKDSIIAGREIDKDGQVVFPGFVQLKFAAVKPEFQEKLTGQGAGTMIETPTGKFEVLEVFDPVEAKAEAATPAEVPAADTVPQLEAALSPTAEA